MPVPTCLPTPTPRYRPRAGAPRTDASPRATPVAQATPSPARWRPSAIRQEFMAAVTGEDIAVIVRALIDKAKAGDVAAARLVLQYTLGKPAATVDPDRLDEMEWEQWQREQASADSDKVWTAMHASTANAVARAIIPVMQKEHFAEFWAGSSTRGRKTAARRLPRMSATRHGRRSGKPAARRRSPARPRQRRRCRGRRHRQRPRQRRSPTRPRAVKRRMRRRLTRRRMNKTDRRRPHRAAPTPRRGRCGRSASPLTNETKRRGAPPMPTPTESDRPLQNG